MTEWQDWQAWPTCRRCGRRRQSVCPMCGSAGISFPLAEYQAVGTPQRNSRQQVSQEAGELLPDQASVLLMCTDCDEAFEARFYRICPNCGEDAGEGLEVPVSADEARQFTPRLMLVIYSLLAVILVTLFYFWLLFRSR